MLLLRARSVAGVCVLVGSVVMTLGWLGAAGASSGVSVGGVHVLTDAHSGVLGVSCRAPGRCLAVGWFTTGLAAFSVIRGAPGQAHGLAGVPPAGSGPSPYVGPACPTSQTCFVLGRRVGSRAGAGVVVRLVGGVDRGTTTLPGSFQPGQGIGCVSSSTCFVDAFVLRPSLGDVLYTLTDGKVTTKRAFSGAGRLSCVQGQGCVAIGNSGVVTISATGVVIGTPTPLSNQNQLGDLADTPFSCPSLSSCWAVVSGPSGVRDELVRIDPRSGTVSPPTRASAIQQFDSISCWTATACMLGGSLVTTEGSNGFPALVRATAGVFGTPHVLLSSPGRRGVLINGGIVDSLQCFSASTCTATGFLYRGGVGAGFTAWN